MTYYILAWLGIGALLYGCCQSVSIVAPSKQPQKYISIKIPVRNDSIVRIEIFGPIEDDMWHGDTLIINP